MRLSLHSHEPAEVCFEGGSTYEAKALPGPSSNSSWVCRYHSQSPGQLSLFSSTTTHRSRSLSSNLILRPLDTCIGSLRDITPLDSTSEGCTHAQLIHRTDNRRYVCCRETM